MTAYSSDYDDKACCVHCFCDEWLIDWIEKNGQKGNCTYCDAVDVMTVPPDQLADLFSPVVSLYGDAHAHMPLESLKECEYPTLAELLNGDWSIFADEDHCASILNEMFSSDDDPDPAGTWAYNMRDWYGPANSIEDEIDRDRAWKSFKNDMMNRNRYFPQGNFRIDSFLRNIDALDLIVESGTWCRSRIEESNSPYPKEKMGAPLPKEAKAGRANPVGIPYLYLASDTETAIREVRAKLDQRVSVAAFTLKAGSQLKLADVHDLSVGSPFQYGNDLLNIMEYKPYYRGLGRELQRPVNPHISDIEYVPTQYLCEAIKLKGYDGIKYGSSMSKTGHNIVLFNCDKVECVEVESYKITDVSFTKV